MTASNHKEERKEMMKTAFDWGGKGMREREKEIHK
jgi:hypothetical protein